MSVMAVSPKGVGLNATTTITSDLAPTPLVALIHVTSDSASITWKSNSTKVARVTLK